jgi:membrane-associated protease RseP (regulator of RpoE activity)
MIGAAAAGCSTTPETARDGSGAIHRVATESAPAAPQKEPTGTAASRPPKSATPPVALEAYEVRESAFSDFGMSVKTNFEVKWGGNVEWMTVTAVAPASSASRAGIAAGDRILAIDGRKISEMDRDAMLAALFQRKKGDRSRLLVLGPREGLPRFVSLIANRP